LPIATGRIKTNEGEVMALREINREHNGRSLALVTGASTGISYEGWF
jgi:hypothetical protein